MLLKFSNQLLYHMRRKLYNTIHTYIIQIDSFMYIMYFLYKRYIMSSLGLPIHIKYIWYIKNPHNPRTSLFNIIYICYVTLQSVSCMIR